MKLEVAEMWRVCVVGIMGGKKNNNNLFWKELSLSYREYRNPVSKEVRAGCVFRCVIAAGGVCIVDV